MSHRYFGPVTLTRSFVSPDPLEWSRNPLGQRLMSHYGAQPEGVNVYIMRSGAVTTEDPIDWDLVARALWGGHYEIVSDAEALLLIAAGYGAYLDTSPPTGYSDLYTDLYGADGGIGVYSNLYTDVYT